MIQKSELRADFAEEITAGIHRTFHAVSVRGERHRKEGSFNQDYFRCGIHSQFAFLATADGLGSSEFAHYGAEKAVSLFEEIVVGAIKQSGIFNEEVFPFILHQFHESWLKHFGLEVKQYDTTFQYIIVFADFAVCGSIGDGLLMMASSEKMLFVKQNEELFSNQTNSMASEKTFGTLQMEVVPLSDVQSQPLIFMLATDGISDDLKPELVEKLPAYLIKQRQTQTTISMQNEINQWVMDWQTSNHSDDRTLCFYLMEKVGVMK